MEKFREFQGRDLDECIREACAYFDAPREKLEVEIIQDAKTGIFGIVLARKAKIRARRVSLEEAVSSVIGTRPPRPRKKEAQKATPRMPEEAPPDSGRPASQGPDAPEMPEGRKATPATPESAPAPDQPEIKPEREEAEREDGFVCRPLDELDREQLTEAATRITSRLIEPIAGHPVPLTVDITPGSVRVKVAWEGDAGLLIGREGQTLAAVQYLASRMISHAFNCVIRVQVDIADYRSKQDDKLRELALSLAQKAVETGRPCSTRPLSSYHRRLVHMALQDNDRIITRSSGEGAMKRVVIAPRKHPLPSGQ